MFEVIIEGTLFLTRKTIDIVDSEQIYGWDIYNEDQNFLQHYDIDDEEDMIKQLKIDYESGKITLDGEYE